LRWIAAALLAVALLAVALLTAALYLREMGGACGRSAGNSRIIPWTDGRIEFAAGGFGPPVLVVHGTGGGFGRGRLIGQSAVHAADPER
jgi:hypothetical protein